MLTLAKEGLLTTLGYVGGHWRPAADGATFDVVNPADGGVVARVADYGADEAADAIAAAEAALPAWRAALPKERSDLLRRWHDLVLQHQEDLARILTAEQGKPLAEARGEILYGTSFIEWFAEEGKRIYGDTMTVLGRDKRILVVKQPVGVVAAITPWNFPNAMITRKIAAALAAGCTVIVKPSEETPLSVLALMVLAEEAGMPAGVLNVLATTKAAAVGGRLMASSAVRKVSFAGSTAVGKQLMRQSAATLKKLSLELGGNAPLIVFDAADIDVAVAGLLVAKFRNARALLGGGPAARAVHFFQPTVLADVSPAMDIARSEVFGPVAPVMRFETEAQAIRLANDTPYGLAAYFYARDLGRVIRVYEALEYGMVGVNDGAISSEIIPFGGMKESGFGREGSKYGIDEYLSPTQERQPSRLQSPLVNRSKRMMNRSKRMSPHSFVIRSTKFIPPVSNVRSNMSLTNQEWAERRMAAIPRGVSQTSQIYTARAQNAELWDVEGRRYIDFAAGIAVVNTGHNHPRVKAAVQAQLDRFSHTCFQVAPYEDYVVLAERLNRLAPGDAPKKTIFLTTGAEAVENAVKIARAATGRSAVIAFSGGFHGRTFMGMALTGKVAPYKAGFGPMPGEVFHVPFPNAYEGVDLETSLSALDMLFHSDVDPARVAAIIIEPVQGEGGFNIAPTPLLKRLRQICDTHGILLIADEIQTGFARTGRLFACDHASIEPDLIAMAKGIAGGFPLSAVTGKAAIMDAPSPGGLGGTYAGSPIACAAALAVLDVIQDENLADRALAIGDLFHHQLGRLAAASNGAIGDIRGLGAMVAIELVKNGDPGWPDAELTKAIVAKAQEHGLILLACGTRSNVIRFLPPLTASDGLVLEGLNLLEATLADLGVI